MSANRSRVMHMAHILDQHTFVQTGRRWPWAQILKYAWYFEHFRGWLQTTTVTFSYWKKDGSIREAHGTLCMDLIPESQRPKGTKSSIVNRAIINYYDLDRQAWRSFDIRLFIGFVTIHPTKEKRSKRENHAGRDNNL